VSREVGFVLLLVVFESHPVTRTKDTTVYIHMSIQRLGAMGIGGSLNLMIVDPSANICSTTLLQRR
jgi:hypothetical protein